MLSDGRKPNQKIDGNLKFLASVLQKLLMKKPLFTQNFTLNINASYLSPSN